MEGKAMNPHAETPILDGFQLEVETIRSKIKASLREMYRQLSTNREALFLITEIYIGDAYMTHVFEHGLMRIENNQAVRTYTWSELDTEMLLWAVKQLELERVL